MTEQISNEKMEKSAKTLATMFDYLGLKANVKIKKSAETPTLFAESEDAGRIIGKRGQSLKNLELLINRIASKNDINCPWISIDVDGYSSSPHSRGKSNFRDEKGSFGKRKPRNSERRFERSSREHSRRRFSEENSEETLKQMALDAAKEVKKWGEPVQLRPMNAHDRRIVHVTLMEDSELTSESLPVRGYDNLKTIVVSLKQQASQQQ